jgi:predicted enzyme related to lactoylglutathione lyase
MFMLPGMGGVVQGKEYSSDTGGVLIYLDFGENFDAILARIKPAGGEIMMPKTAMGDHGFSAIFLDLEGNRVGLASSTGKRSW